jgi:GAF domain-containing protein
VRGHLDGDLRGGTRRHRRRDARDSRGGPADRSRRRHAVQGLARDCPIGIAAAAEGSTAWTADSTDPQTIVVSDVTGEPALTALLPAMADERIAAMLCLPLLSLGRAIGKLVLYFEAPCDPEEDDLQLAGIIAAEVAFAVERARAEHNVRREVRSGCVSRSNRH